MGQPKFARKKYETPNHPWQGERIKTEHELRRKFGLKNKTEIWKAQSRLRTIRGQARELVSRTRNPDDEQAQAEAKLLLRRLHREGYIAAEATLNEVLGLDLERILNRRLQSQVYLKGMARTPKQARQFVSHGLVVIGERRVTVPGYVVRREDEDLIQFAPSATVADPDHPVRPKAPGQEVVAESATVSHGGQSVTEKPTEGDAPVKSDAAPTVAPSEGQRAEDAQREAPPGKAPPAGSAKSVEAPEAPAKETKGEAAVKDAAPEETPEAPAQQAPAKAEDDGKKAPAKEPAAKAAAKEAPAATEEAPAKEAPAKETPAKETPKEAPAKETKAEAKPAAKEAPAATEETPAKEAPDEGAKQEAPAKEAEAKAAKEAPAKETPAKETPKEAPAKETKAEAKPADEAKAAPAKETKAADKAEETKAQEASEEPPSETDKAQANKAESEDADTEPKKGSADKEGEQ